MDFLKTGGKGREGKRSTNAVALFVHMVSMSTSYRDTSLLHGVTFSIGVILVSILITLNTFLTLI